MTADEAVRACDRLIRYHAAVIARRTPGVECEDLFQVGAMEVVKALPHYDPAVGANFRTYATVRVVGAMIDHVREVSWAPRLEVKRAKAEGRLVAYMQPLSSVQIVSARQVNGDNKNRPLKRSLAWDSWAFEEPVYFDPGPDESEAELIGRLREMGVNLTDRERQAVVLYFARGMLHEEVARSLGVHQTRATQLIRGVLLRAGMDPKRRTLANGHKSRRIKFALAKQQQGANGG